MSTNDQKAARERVEAHIAGRTQYSSGNVGWGEFRTDLRTLLSERDALAARVAVLEGHKTFLTMALKARDIDVTGAAHPAIAAIVALDHYRGEREGNPLANVACLAPLAHPTPEALARAERMEALSWPELSDKMILAGVGAWLGGAAHIASEEWKGFIRTMWDAMIAAASDQASPAIARTTADHYEAAIQKMEAVYRPNKSRSWVLKMLREQIAKEVRSAQSDALTDHEKWLSEDDGGGQ